MSVLLEAVKAKLSAITINAAGDLLPVILHDGTGHPYPRAVLWGGPTRGTDEPSVAGARGRTSARMGVTLAAETGTLADRLAMATIEAITPGCDPSVITAAGARYDLIFDEHRGVEIDWQVTIPNADHHPAFVVLLFTIHSQPI